MAKCPFCGRYRPTRDEMFDHMETAHGSELERSGMDAPQALYHSVHGTIHGRCMVCGKPTEWNPATGKPRKMCDDPNCRKKMKAQYDRNLLHARGIDQHTLMSDVEHQKEMLAKRRISGSYRFRDGGSIDYVGQLEATFLRFCDTVMEFRSNQILPSPETFTYHDPKDNQDHIYIPDYYFPDYELLVEIKDADNGNPAFLEETRYKVPLKDEAMRRQTRYNYIRISGTEYGPFLDILYRIVHGTDAPEKPKRVIVVVNETAMEDSAANYEPEETTPSTEKVRLIFGYVPRTNIPKFLAITNSRNARLWYVTDYETQDLYAATGEHPVFGGHGYRTFRYVGEPEPMAKLLALAIPRATNASDDGPWNLLELMASCGVFVDDGHEFRNNPERRMDFSLTNEDFTDPITENWREDE